MHQKPATAEPGKKPRRRWYQVGLRTLLITGADFGRKELAIYPSRFHSIGFLCALQIGICAISSISFTAEIPTGPDEQAKSARMGSPQDAAKAIAWLRMHSAKEEGRAQFQLGQCYEQGWSVSKDLKTAIDWYRAAAKNHEALASLRLSALYLGGDGVDRDATTALRFLRQAADAGSPDAEYLVGWCYEYGVLNESSVVAVDVHSILLTCLLRMMDASSPGKMILVQGRWSQDCKTVKPVPKAAGVLYTQSSASHYAPASLLILGTYIVSGAEEEQVQQCIRTLSRQDDPLILAYYEVAKAWLRATKFRSLVPDDSARSMSKLEELAKNGDPDAMDCLARLAVGSAADAAKVEEATEEKWQQKSFFAWRREAEAGDAVAQYKTAIAYVEGKYVARDVRAAADWYVLASEGGYPWAQVALANCYEKGSGVERDLKKAEAWRRKAARQGVQ